MGLNKLINCWLEQENKDDHLHRSDFFLSFEKLHRRMFQPSFSQTLKRGVEFEGGVIGGEKGMKGGGVG